MKDIEGARSSQPKVQSFQEAETDPPGFCLYVLDFFDQQVALYLPTLVKDQIERDARERRRRRDEELRQAQDAQDERLRASANSPSSSSIRRTPAPPAIPDRCPEQPKHTVAVYDWQEATERFRALENSPSSGDKDVVKRDLRLFERAMADGPWRLIAPALNWKKSLSSLALEMPNFRPVVEFVAQRLALAALSKTPLQPPPILLLGDPGVGKTYFAQRLAEALRTEVYRQAFDNVQGKGALRGTDRYWSNTSVGALWELIVLGKHANPIIILDELDKGAVGGNGYRPVDELLTLLEPVTSRHVKDQSMNFELDASYVWYIATANDADSISAPIRSRFTEFRVDAPDIDGRLVLAKSIFEATLARLVPSKRIRARFKAPSNMQICRLAWLTPRKIRMTSERVLGAAVLAGRWHLEDTDFNEALKSVEQRVAAKPRPRRDDGDPAPSIVVEILP